MPFVLHLYLPSFYTRLEQQHSPQLQGKPVAVIKNHRILDVSPEALVQGINPTVSLRQARLACPELITVEANKHYWAAARKVWDICSQFTPVVEPLAPDEGFLDITGCGEPSDIAHSLVENIQTHTNFSALVSIGPSKFVAKAACLHRLKAKGPQVSQPEFILIPPQSVRNFLHSLPVRYLWQYPQEIADKLMDLGCRTFEDLEQIPLEQLRLKFGLDGQRIAQLVTGQDNDPVKAVYPDKQIWCTYTCPPEMGGWDIDVIKQILEKAAVSLNEKLTDRDQAARRITVTTKGSSGQTHRETRLLQEPIYNTPRLTRELIQLSRQFSSFPVVELKIQLGELSPRVKSQLGLYTDSKRQLQAASLQKAVRYLAEKLGPDTVKPASALKLPRRERMLQLVEQNII